MKFIETIEIKNFKSIRHQKIEGCKRINIFIGYPNTGKSNLLEAIGLFGSFQLKNEYFTLNEICRVKNFSELFLNKEYRNTASVTINNRLLLELGINQSNDLEVRLKRFDELGKPEPGIVNSTIINNRGFNFQYSREIVDSDYSHIVDPIRKYEFKNDGIINQQKPFTLAVPFGNNLLDILQRDSKLRKEMARIFDDYNLNVVLDEKDIIFLKYLSDNIGVSIPYHQVADTLRRLIFYKAAIYSNNNSVLLFEEPEAHMFPPYIRKFTSDVIFSATNQFFVTTHSPYVFDAFLEDAPNETSVYLVYYQDGETKIKIMQPTEIDEIRAFGVDLFFNLESYLKHGQVDNA